VRFHRIWHGGDDAGMPRPLAADGWSNENPNANDHWIAVGVELARVDHDWKQWIGRTQTATDWITPARVAAWHATLDHAGEPPGDGEPAPLGLHWTLAPHVARESELGTDGHAKRGGFLPPIPLPRRLWAGSRVTFRQALHVGERVERASEIVAVEEKRGRESALVFVTVRHRFNTNAGVAIEEEQDLVYREAASQARASRRDESPKIKPEWRHTIRPTETLLFRYSALTFNTHRIHYDWRYATQVEGYGGLVVHGPLIATLLLDLLSAQVGADRVERFQFRAMRPTLDTSDFEVCGAPSSEDGHFKLWSTDNDGATAVDADAWVSRARAE
jgi:3-methylfumaryl-CoA hydratase